MEQLSVLLAGLTAVILFIFGLEHFSAEIEQVSGDRFRRFLGRATRVPAIGVFIGALVTAIIQSSSATSVITISLVNAGVLSFKNSVGIIFGSNIGTTVTAQLVAFKLTSFAPALIIIGFALSLMHNRVAIFGKSIFYFGFVLFCLNLISTSLAPLQENVLLTSFLMEPQHPLLAILVGCVFTALIQSSSVTTALAIIFTQQGLLGLENAVPLIMGANVGTTATAFVAVFNMDTAAKKTALAHFLFNVGGVLIFLPVLLLFGSSLSNINAAPEFVLAGLHLVFNIGTSLLFLLLINPFTRLVERMLGESKMDFERIVAPTFSQGTSFEDKVTQLEQNLISLLEFLQENYSLVTLSIETNYRSVFEVSAKRQEYIEYLKAEYMGFFSRQIAETTDEDESRQLLNFVTRFDYLFQIHDSINDLFATKTMMNKNYIELKSDILLLVRELSSQTLSLFDEIRKDAKGEDADVSPASKSLQKLLERTNKVLLSLLASPGRRDAGSLTNFITYSRRLRDKLINFAAMESNQPKA